MFVNKAKSLPKQKGHCKVLRSFRQRTNAIAYFSPKSVMNKKSFMTLRQGANAIKI
jgi:hypothetical protein